jgi:hypothetical protein
LKRVTGSGLVPDDFRDHWQPGIEPDGVLRRELA